MSVFSISPIHGTRIAATYAPVEYRRKFPNDLWYYNPWTGTRRTEMDIASDPQGLMIQPPNEPVYAGLTRDQYRDYAEHFTRKPVKETQDTITDTLTERGKRYGKFTGHAQISQDLEDVMRACPKWAALAADQKEALKMVVHKIARILNGDPDYDDSWVDIAGYSKLVADRLQGIER